MGSGVERAQLMAGRTGYLGLGPGDRGGRHAQTGAIQAGMNLAS